jgi:hypothetical protein
MALNPRLTKSDATYAEMERIVRSEEGRRAAIEAAHEGYPAICGVDPLLRENLGSRYKVIDHGTRCAGTIVAELMHELGYRSRPRKPCPLGCLARTGILWISP